MNIGVISYLFRHHDTATAMGILRDLGFTAVELDFRHADGRCDYRKADAAAAAEVRRLVERHGIAPRAYCIGGLKNDHAAQLPQIFEFAKGLGVDVITGCIIEAGILPEVSACTERYGIRYAIENHRGNIFETADALLPALETCAPSVGVTADTGHFALAGCVPVEEIRKLAGRVYHVHFKDTDQHRPLGSGDADLPAVYRELQAQGFKGLVSIEHYEYAGVEEDVLRAGLADGLRYVQRLGTSAASAPSAS